MSAERGLTAVVKIKEEEIPADISMDGVSHRSTRDKGTSCRQEQEYRDEEVHHPVKEENLNIVVVDIGPENARGNEMGMRMDDMEMHPDTRTPYTKPRKGYMRKPYKKWWSPAKNHGVVHKVTSNSQSDDVEFEIHDEIMASIRRQRKKKMYNNTSEEELGERLLTQAAALLTKNNDEFDAFGFMVSSKLRRMDEQQRLLAEVLIMEVLYKGMLGQLTEDSLVCQYPAQFYQNQPSS